MKNIINSKYKNDVTGENKIFKFQKVGNNIQCPFHFWNYKWMGNFPETVQSNFENGNVFFIYNKSRYLSKKILYIASSIKTRINDERYVGEGSILSQF